MTDGLRVIDTGLKSARWNIAMTAALTQLHRRGRAPDTIRFHRYPQSVLLGRSETLDHAVHADLCKACNVEIARRVTGGGAVYMAQGALAWDVVVSRKSAGHELDRAAAVIGTALASGLRSLGLGARYRSPNDIEVDGRKICGLSGIFEGSSLAYQGTILVDTDFEDMMQFLRLPDGIDGPALAARLVGAASLLGRLPRDNEIEGAVSTALAAAFDRNLRPDVASAEEWALANRLHDEEFGTDDFAEGVDMLPRSGSGGAASKHAQAAGDADPSQQVRMP